MESGSPIIIQMLKNVKLHKIIFLVYSIKKYG